MPNPMKAAVVKVLEILAKKGEVCPIPVRDLAKTLTTKSWGKKFGLDDSEIEEVSNLIPKPEKPKKRAPKKPTKKATKKK